VAGHDPSLEDLQDVNMYGDAARAQAAAAEAAYHGRQDLFRLRDTLDLWEWDRNKHLRQWLLEGGREFGFGDFVTLRRAARTVARTGSAEACVLPEHLPPLDERLPFFPPEQAPTRYNVPVPAQVADAHGLPLSIQVSSQQLAALAAYFFPSEEGAGRPNALGLYRRVGIRESGVDQPLSVSFFLFESFFGSYTWAGFFERFRFDFFFYIYSIFLFSSTLAFPFLLPSTTQASHVLQGGRFLGNDVNPHNVVFESTTRNEARRGCKIAFEGRRLRQPNEDRQQSEAHVQGHCCTRLRPNGAAYNYHDPPCGFPDADQFSALAQGMPPPPGEDDEEEEWSSEDDEEEG